MRRLLPISAALALALFLCMLWYGWAVLVPAAGGQWPFEARVFGYAPEVARGYLEALDSRGRAVSLVEMHWLHSAFGPMLGLALGLAIVAASRGAHFALRLVLLLPVVLYLALHLAEGITVQEMLLRGAAQFNTRLAEWASLFTRAKFGALLAIVLILLGLRRHRRG